MLKNWHEPKQERSRKRFLQIINSAEKLFAEQGFDRVTTNHIADQAGVSIGSLYQFFPNKEAILGVLVNNYIEEIKAILPQTKTSVASFNDVIARMIDDIFTFDAEHRAFSAILTGVNPIQFPEPIDVMHNSIIEIVMTMLESAYPDLTVSNRRRCATVGVGIVMGIWKMPQLSGQEQADEMKQALWAYIRDFVSRQ